MPASKEDYEVLEVIGQGSFGKVCRVRRMEDGKVSVNQCVCVCVCMCLSEEGVSW
jgi:hypothetical protein